MGSAMEAWSCPVPSGRGRGAVPSAVDPPSVVVVLATVDNWACPDLKAGGILSPTALHV